MKGQSDVILRIRPGMDVFDVYQDEYIGIVIQVWRAVQPAQGGPLPDTHQAELHPGPIAVEEHSQTSPTQPIFSKESGEEMGPFPTIAVGNTGPINQSAARHYATQPTSEPGVTYFAVRPGRLNLGPLTPPLYVPSSAVRSISLERVILEVEKGQIPREWRRPPHQASS